MSKPTVLVAEDESALVTLLRYNLEREGYRVIEARDGEEALLVAAEEQPDLVVLDWMLPQLSGIEVCRRLRGRQETRNVPIIMQTARGEESDRIRGLDTGADDYLTKPFSMTELLARLRAVLRRIRPSLAEDVVAVGDIEMDRAAHRVRRAGTDVHLGPTEYRLLDHLIRGHAELLLHMNRRGGNEGMNPPRIGRLDRLARPRNIVFVGTRQRTHGGILDGLGNGVDRIEVARRGRRETGLDHIDAHLFKLAGNTQLFFLGHRGARALLAVAQGRIKNDEMLLHENTPTIRPACA